LWLYPVIPDEAKDKAHWDQVVSAFQTANPGVTVDYEVFPWANRDEALQTAIASGTGPDLVYLIPDQLSAYQDSIEPMTNYLSDDRKADLLDNVKASVTIGGELMGAPILTSSTPLLCNASAFKAAGVDSYPTTWDDVVAMAPKFTAKGMYALFYPGSSDETLNTTFYPLLWQAGGSVYTDNGASVGFDSQAGLDALTFLTNLQKMKALEPDALTTTPALEQTALAQGKVGCTWSREVNDLSTLWAPSDLVVLPPLSNQKSVTYGTVGVLAMLKGAKDKAAAGAFAEFATGADQMVPFVTTAGYFSPLKSTGDIYPNDPVQQKVQATLPSTTAGELFPSSRALQGAIIPEIQAALLGQKDPQAALDAAKAAAQPLIAG